jgi:hypothetical protein
MTQDLPPYVSAKCQCLISPRKLLPAR